MDDYVGIAVVEVFMEERRKDRSESRPMAVAKQLQHVAREGGCDLIVVAAKDGAMVGTGEHMPKEAATVLSGLAAEAFRMREQITAILSVDDVEDFTLTSSSSCSVLCRFFSFRGTPLAAIVRTCEPGFDPALLGRIETGVQRILEAKDLDLSRVGSRAG